MSLNLLRPIYPCEPIGSPERLAKALGCDIERLRLLAANANHLYRLAKPITKPDGTIRQPFDALPELKQVHRRLKDNILSRVIFPHYLTGSVRGEDYKTNAELHIDSKIVICEDIKSFFPSVRDQIVYCTWNRFFNFPPEVADLLTKLTTKDGALPQGAIPSSFLANLVLWQKEPTLQANLALQGVVYSRYVDDIAMSSKTSLSKEQQTKLIAATYGMLASIGLQAKRKKHETFDASRRMTITKLVVNKRAALPQAKRSNIRAAVDGVERLSREGPMDPNSLVLLARVSVQVGQLGRFHPKEASLLKERLRLVRSTQRSFGVSSSATQTFPSEVPSTDTDTSPPW